MNKIYNPGEKEEYYFDFIRWYAYLMFTLVIVLTYCTIYFFFEKTKNEKRENISIDFFFCIVLFHHLY